MHSFQFSKLDPIIDPALSRWPPDRMVTHNKQNNFSLVLIVAVHPRIVTDFAANFRLILTINSTFKSHPCDFHLTSSCSLQTRRTAQTALRANVFWTPGSSKTDPENLAKTAITAGTTLPLRWPVMDLKPDEDEAVAVEVADAAVDGEHPEVDVVDAERGSLKGSPEMTERK